MSDTPPSSATDSAEPFILKPPLPFRIAQALLALGLAVLVAWSLYLLSSGENIFIRSHWTILFTAALVGLIRRVTWGFFLTSIVCILACLGVLLFAIPWPDDRVEERGLTPLFGTLPPAWVSVTLVIVTCILILTPLVVIGGRKNYFRARLW